MQKTTVRHPRKKLFKESSGSKRWSWLNTQFSAVKFGCFCL